MASRAWLKCEIAQLSKAMTETGNNFSVVFIRGPVGSSTGVSEELINEEVLELDRTVA